MRENYKKQQYKLKVYVAGHAEYLGLDGEFRDTWVAAAKAFLDGIDHEVIESSIEWMARDGVTIHGFKGVVTPLESQGFEMSADVWDDVASLLYATRAACYRETFYV